MKEIGFTLEIQGDNPTVLCSIIKNLVTVHENNQGAIALAIAPKMWPRTNHIAIKYYYLQSSVANGDAEIQHIDNKQQIADIFTKLLYS